MSHTETLRAALQGVIKVADRDTDEFNAARAALAATEEPEQSTEPFGWAQQGVGMGWRAPTEKQIAEGAIPLYAHPDPRIADLTAQLLATAAQYQELLYQVGKKYPGEIPHETAMRYLGQAEQDDTDYSVAASAATRRTE